MIPIKLGIAPQTEEPVSFTTVQTRDRVDVVAFALHDGVLAN